MDDYVGRFHLVPDDGYTSPVVLLSTAVSRSRVGIQRRRQLCTRRGPRRAVRSMRTLWNAFTAGWEFDLSDDAESLKFLFESLCDRGSAAAVTGGTEWTIGYPNGYRTFGALAVTADERAYSLSGGVCQEFAITVEPGRLVGAAARWEFSKLAESKDADPNVEFAGTEWASPVASLLTWDGVELDTFSVALNIARDFAPAGWNADGVATAFNGRIVPDIVGKMACRIASDDDDLFLGQLSRPLRLDIIAGGTLVRLDFPAVTFEVLQRVVAANGTTEHLVTFLATMAGDDPLAKFSLLTA